MISRKVYQCKGLDYPHFFPRVKHVIFIILARSVERLLKAP